MKLRWPPFRRREREEQEGEREARLFREELAAAYSLFNEATDPLLVEQAIHRLLAAEKGYDHLLLRLRREVSGAAEG